jgi:hypothetical protein
MLPRTLLAGAKHSESIVRSHRFRWPEVLFWDMMRRVG